jgi:hypothetical protein
VLSYYSAQPVCGKMDAINQTHTITHLLRLINLIAEDNAIEDTIYHLHKALNAGRIDLDRFIKVNSTISKFLYWDLPITLRLPEALPKNNL